MLRVVLTGADGQVGRALVGLLRAPQFESVALIRRPAALSAGRTIVGSLDSPAGVSAMEEADCVVHLAGTLRPRRGNSYRGANLETSEAVVRALRRSRARRVLYLSYVGASEASGNAYLRTKALAERALAASAKELVVFRCTHIIGSRESPGPTAEAMRVAPGRRAMILGSGRQRVAPLFLGDVATALKVALTNGKPGIYDLCGPDVMSMDDLVRLVNRDPRLPIGHVPGCAARLLGLFMPGLPASLVDVMLRESVGDAARAIATFHLRPVSLHEVWNYGAPAANVGALARSSGL